MPDNRNSPQDCKLAFMLRNVNKAEPPPHRFECGHPASPGAGTTHCVRLSRPNQRKAGGELWKHKQKWSKLPHFLRNEIYKKLRGPLPYPSSQGSAGKAMAEGCKPWLGLLWGCGTQSSHRPSLIGPPGTHICSVSASFSSELKTSPGVCPPSRAVN